MSNINKKQWEKFGSIDAEYYIDTEAKNPQEFWGRGEENFQTYILPLLKKYNITPGVAVDFGCGIGRHTFPLAEYFTTVYGIDIASSMLKKGQSIADEQGISNIHFVENSNFFNLPIQANFIYCANVFQHIESKEDIEKILHYFSQITTGYVYLHVDTRQKDWLYYLKNTLPDWLLPKSQRRGIRRIRRSVKEIEDIITTAKFSIIEQTQPNSPYHFFLLSK